MYKKVHLIEAMTSELETNVRTYKRTIDSKDSKNCAYYGYNGITQQQSKTGLVRQIVNIRAELLELKKMIEG